MWAARAPYFIPIIQLQLLAATIDATAACAVAYSPVAVAVLDPVPVILPIKWIVEPCSEILAVPAAATLARPT